MNKEQATKLAERITNDGFRCNFRHYGKGSWAVQIDGGRVFDSVEAYDDWRKAQRFYAE